MAALVPTGAGALELLQGLSRIMGYHRDTFYEVRRAFQVGGVAALVEQRRGPRGRRWGETGQP